MKFWTTLTTFLITCAAVQGKYYEIDDIDFYPYPVAAGADFYTTLTKFKLTHSAADLEPLKQSLTTYKQQLASCILFQTNSPIINLGWSKIVLRMCSEGYINAKKSLEAIDQCATKPKSLHRTEVTRKAELKDTTFKKEWTIELFCGSNKASSALEKTYRVGKSMTKLFWWAPRKVYDYSKHKKYYDLHTEFRKHFDQNYHPNVTSSKSDRPTIRRTDGALTIIQNRYRNFAAFTSFTPCHHMGCWGPHYYPVPVFVGNHGIGGSGGGGSNLGDSLAVTAAVIAITYLFVASSTLVVGGGYKLVHTINKNMEMKKEIRGLYTLDANGVKVTHGAIQMLCKELPEQNRPPVCNKDAIRPLNVKFYDIAQDIAPPAYY